MTNVYACITWEVADIRNALKSDSFEPPWSDEAIEDWLKANEEKLHDVMLQAGWHYIYEDITDLKESAKCYKK
tara:strand:+ start:913 stop:1131 length:219 start_codon:yes stop_codon:yes gene_type:complete